MDNLPQAAARGARGGVRAALARGRRSARCRFDGTRKYLFRLDDGATIEAVYIPEDDRRTICISTQAGCPLKCAFCLTGIAGYKRNLKAWEILGQVATVMDGAPGRRDAPAPPRRGPLPVEHRGDGDGGAAAQLRGHASRRCAC